VEVAEDGRRVQVARRGLAEGGGDHEAQALLIARREGLRSGGVARPRLVPVLAFGRQAVRRADVQQPARLERVPRLGQVRLARAEGVDVDHVEARAVELAAEVQVDRVGVAHVAPAVGHERRQVGLERVLSFHELVGKHEARAALEHVPQRAHAAAAHRVQHARPRHAEHREREHAQVTNQARRRPVEE